MGKVAKTVFLAPVRLYRKLVSPAIGRNCIYTPTCSQYMIDAVEKHGVLKGAVLGTARLLRCNKHFLGGPDPVPETYSFKYVRQRFTIFKRH